MRIVRREVSDTRIFAQFFVLIMLGNIMFPGHGNLLYSIGISLISRGLTVAWLNWGEKSTMMRCLERGPDYTIDRKHDTVTFHRPGDYEITSMKNVNDEKLVVRVERVKSVLDTSPKE